MHHGSGVMQHHLHLSKLTRRITSSRYRYQFVSIKKNWGDNKNIQRSSLRRRGRGESRTISALDSNCVDKIKYYAISKFNSFLKNKKIRAVGIFIDSTFLETRSWHEGKEKVNLFLRNFIRNSDKSRSVSIWRRISRLL